MKGNGGRGEAHAGSGGGGGQVRRRRESQHPQYLLVGTPRRNGEVLRRTEPGGRGREKKLRKERRKETEIVKLSGKKRRN